MTIVDALKILGLPIKSTLSTKDVKSTFRKRMRECHPDINPDIDDHVAADLNEAYRIVMNSIETGELADIISKYAILENYARQNNNVPTIVITVDQLCEIYSGKTLELKALDNRTYKINKENRNIFKFIIAFRVKIETESTEDTRTAVLTFYQQVRDTYSSEIDLDVESLDIDYIAKLSCGKTVMNLNMPKGVKRLQLRMKFDYNIILDITFTKKVVSVE